MLFVANNIKEATRIRMAILQHCRLPYARFIIIFFERDHSAKIIITSLMKLHHSQHDHTFQASYHN